MNLIETHFPINQIGSTVKNEQHISGIRMGKQKKYVYLVFSSVHNERVMSFC